MGRDLSRRDVLKRLLGATGIGTAIGFSSVAYDRTARAGARPVEKFRTALPIPPILRPVRSDATTDFYEVTERPASVEILPRNSIRRADSIAKSRRRIDGQIA